VATQIEISNAITRLYIAAFQRAPELDGFDYWMAMASANGIKATLNSIFNLPIVQNIYSASLSNDAFVTSIYNNVFNKAPDSEGLHYWSSQLGNIGRGELVLNMINAGLGTPIGTAGRDVIVNRVDHARTAVALQQKSGYSVEPASLANQYKAITSASATVEASADSILDGIFNTSSSARAGVTTIAKFPSYSGLLYHSEFAKANLAVNNTVEIVGNKLTSAISLVSYDDNFSLRTSNLLPSAVRASIESLANNKNGDTALLLADESVYFYSRGASTYNVTSLKGVVNLNDSLEQIATQPDGNFIVVGSKNSETINSDAVAVILDTSGHVLAQAQYHSTSVQFPSFGFDKVFALSNGSYVVHYRNTLNSAYYVLDKNLDITKEFAFRDGEFSKLLEVGEGSYVALANGGLVYLDGGFNVTATAKLKFAGDAQYKPIQDLAVYGGHLYALAPASGVGNDLLEFSGVAPGSTVIDAKAVRDAAGEISFGTLRVDNNLAYLSGTSNQDMLAIVPHGQVSANLASPYSVQNVANLTTGTLLAIDRNDTSDSLYGLSASTVTERSAGVTTYHNVSLVGTPVTNTAYTYDLASLPLSFSMGLSITHSF
jgi:hypothetical protein